MTVKSESSVLKIREVKYNEVVCIGLGLSGICLGVQLKRKWNFTDMHFYDRNENYSGTWWVNRYPGSWSRPLPDSDEIRDYIAGVVTEYNLEPYMSFQTECDAAVWDKDRCLWVLHMRNVASGKKFIHNCKILFSAVGQLSQPRLPAVPGIETFKGESFHSSRWKEEVLVDGKNVVVIGNGCTATQMVPELVPKAKAVTQIIQNAHWLLEYKNARFPPGLVRALQTFPFLARILRTLLFAMIEWQWLMFGMNRIGARMRKSAECQSMAYIQANAPQRYHDMLIPDFEIGCKRRIFDVDRAYTKALHSNNFLLTKETILEIKPDGVLTNKNFYSADIIVFATGFQTNKDLGQLRIKGENDLWLDEHWDELGGPSAYNTICVAGYPNFFMLYGPNANSGHTSVMLMVENAIDGAFKLLAPLLRGEATKVDVNKTAYELWAARAQTATKNCIFFAGGCNTDRVGTARPTHGHKFTFGGDKISSAGKTGNIRIVMGAVDSDRSFGQLRWRFSYRLWGRLPFAATIVVDLALFCNYATAR